MSKVLKVVAIVAVAVAVVVFAPAIGAALAHVAGSLGITVTGSAIASYLVGMAITTALTASMTLFRKAPSMSNSMADRLSTSVNPTAPRKIVFGLTAAGNDVRFFETYGNKKDRYVQAIALASHRINAIRGFYVENDLAWNGSTLVSHSDGIESIRAVPEGRPGNGFAIGSGAYWKSSACFTGCAYIAITWKLSNDAWPSGIPASARTVVEGCPVYDPRLDSARGGSGSHRIDNQSTWGWRNGSTEIGRNPALALLTYLIGWKINGKLVWGMGIPAANIDFDSFKTYANICEEQVATQGGGSVQRYTCDGIFSTADAHDTVINAITAAMGSTKMVDVGGAYTLIGGYDDTAGPKVGLTLSDIVGAAGSSTPYIWLPAPASRERFNIVRGRFADPSNLYQLSDWGDPIEQPTLADDVPRTMNLDLGCVSRPETCQRIAKQFLLREYLTPGKFSATFGPNAFAAQVGSIVTLTIPQLGWNAKLFRVEEQAETHDMFYQMTLREESAAVYAWDREEKPLPANIRPTGYDPNDTLSPAAFIVTSQNYQGANNYNVSEVHVGWTPETSGRVTGIQIYSRPVGVDAWTEQAALHDARTGSFIFTSNAPGIDIEVRARFRMSSAVYGPWITTGVTTAPVETVDNSARENAKNAADKADVAQGTANTADGKADAITRNLVGSKLTNLLLSKIDEQAALSIEYGAAAISAASALANTNLTAIQTLQTRIDDNGDKVAEDFLQLTSRLDESEKKLAGINVKGDIEAGLTELRRTIANANYASVETVDKKIAKYGENVSAWQVQEEKARVDADSAVIKTVDEVGARVTKEGTVREAAIKDLREILIDKDGNLIAQRIQGLGTRITVNFGGKPVTLESAIQTIDTSYKTATGTVAESVKTLASRMDDVGGATIEEAFKTVADKVSGVSSQYTLKVQTDQNGQKYIAGMGIAIENGVSAIAFSADSFRIVTPGEASRQLFFADADGVYMPNVRVDKLKAGAIDFEFLNRQSMDNPASGYQALPGGLWLMWGQYRAYIAEERSITVQFPISFPNICLSFTATPYINYASNARDLYIQVVGDATVSGATIYTQGYKGSAALDGFNWFAVGK
ncbi:gp53-like domain-containing protein [Sphingomonas sp. Leaf257]|jgi:hypothetical protein|uniref:gp53-like domain-containing protein n=1 Tax=Sphingomonas sp. Leaf257 TaxID=1736309 RepID=UPI000701BE9B|nr:DUF1983 domain-containing protein [Sphingomonas sp. Leaf257]KQO58397.1 hypothetical protein ASF14_00045 [Sphingomonas sp. Leaf257]